MTQYDKNINNLFIHWLFLSLALVLTIIIVGGLTRLTDSGLSITEWELFSGILPPLTESSWNNYFELYKKIPQYEFLNSEMTLAEFKVIFYWEYTHRILARLIGVFILIPLIYFHFSKKINNRYMTPCYVILFLVITQGIVGWYMVKSGLVNNITVSHYRLALHLTIALVIISIIFWVFINAKKKTYKTFFKFTKNNLPFLFLIFLIFIQIMLGAFVSGLDAGKIYQTWPLMNNSYFPDDLKILNPNILLDFNNHSLVQFYHRNLAYLIIVYIFVLSFYVYKFEIKKLYKPLKLFLFFLFLQISLGILTLISGLNIYLASGHQIISVLLIFSSINLYYFYIK